MDLFVRMGYVSIKIIGVFGVCVRMGGWGIFVILSVVLIVVSMGSVF